MPYGTIWRTGANAATHFTTNRDIRLRDVRLPAGTYTLWSTYTADSATLVVNGQTEIWGTAYDPEHDVAQVPLDRETLGEPVEQFTMAIEPRNGGALLWLAWDTTRYSVPITVP